MLAATAQDFHVGFWEYDKYYAVIQAVDADHAQLWRRHAESGGPDEFDIVKNVRENLDVEEAVS